MGFSSIIVAMVVGYLLNGLALKMLWGWFMVPTFGLPTLSLAQAIGVGIMVGFLTHQYI